MGKDRRGSPISGMQGGAGTWANKGEVMGAAWSTQPNPVCSITWEDESCPPVLVPRGQCSRQCCLCLFALRKGVKSDPALLLFVVRPQPKHRGHGKQRWEASTHHRDHVSPVSALATGKCLHDASQGICLCPSYPYLQPLSVLSGAENPICW